MSGSPAKNETTRKGFVNGRSAMWVCTIGTLTFRWNASANIPADYQIRGQRRPHILEGAVAVDMDDSSPGETLPTSQGIVAFHSQKGIRYRGLEET